MRLSVLFSLHSGAVLQVAKGSYYQHELRLFHSLHNRLQVNEILIYDRAGGHFVLAAQLSQINVDLISRVFKRHIDWRHGKRLGKHDRLVAWKKGPNQPAYLTKEQWAALPEQITVRVLQVNVSRKGCRPQELTLVTTLSQAAREHHVDLYRISFAAAMDALRHSASAMAQAKTAKKRRQLWDDLLRSLAEDLVPERPGRREPRAVKRRPKPYPRFNKPRHQFREAGQLSHCK